MSISKRESLKAYDKIYLLNVPEEKEQQEIAFYTESYNPLLDLWEYNSDRKIKQCEICKRKFVVSGNMKTCSDKCSKVLVKRNKNKK